MIIFKEFPLNVTRFSLKYQVVQLFLTLIIIIVTNQHIKIISEGSCDTAILSCKFSFGEQEISFKSIKQA